MVAMAKGEAGYVGEELGISKEAARTEKRCRMKPSFGRWGLARGRIYKSREQKDHVAIAAIAKFKSFLSRD